MSRRSFTLVFSGCRTPQCCRMTEASPYAKLNTLMFASIFWMKVASCREVSSGSSGGGGGGLLLCTDRRNFPYRISSDAPLARCICVRTDMWAFLHNGLEVKCPLQTARPPFEA